MYNNFSINNYFTILFSTFISVTDLLCLKFLSSYLSLFYKIIQMLYKYNHYKKSLLKTKNH